MSANGEELLLKRVATGDDGAFERLYGLYETRVRLVAWRICKRQDVVDDLVNETWLRAYNQRSSYDAGRPFLNWLGGILQNVWREHARTTAGEQERLAKRLNGHGGPENDTNGDSPEAAIAEAEMLAGLNDCVERLDPGERDIIRWRFFEGQSLRAVAQRLGIAEATLRENRLPIVMGKIERCLKTKGLSQNIFPFSTAQAGDDLQYRSGDNE